MAVLRAALSVGKFWLSTPVMATLGPATWARAVAASGAPTTRHSSPATARTLHLANGVVLRRIIDPAPLHLVARCNLCRNNPQLVAIEGQELDHLRDDGGFARVSCRGGSPNTNAVVARGRLSCPRVVDLERHLFFCVREQQRPLPNLKAGRVQAVDLQAELDAGLGSPIAHHDGAFQGFISP